MSTGQTVTSWTAPPADWRLGLLAVGLTFLIHPLTWHEATVPLWSPPAGFAFVLLAWLGARWGSLALATAAVLQFLRLGCLLALQQPAAPPTAAWCLVDAVLMLAEANLAWWLYHEIGRGNRELSDPRSAMQFILLVPLLASGLAALARLLLAEWVQLPGVPPGGFGLRLATFWFERALGVLVIAPPLLVVVTPWLERRRILKDPRVHAENGRASTQPPLSPGGSTAANSVDSLPMQRETASLGDWLEILGLALGASLLCLILSRLHGRRELMGWQLWGVQILLIVWASLRQGLRGGTLTAATATAVPLLFRPFGTPPEDNYFLPLLQAHLLAQCSAALLVAASSSWIRIHETGYRQVVSHVPVVIYSARFRPNRATPSPRVEPPRRGSDEDSSVESPPLEVPAEITLVSAACVRLLGRPADELLGDYRHWLDCVHPEDHVVVLAALEQLGRQQEPVICEYRLAGMPAAAAVGTMAPQIDGTAPPVPRTVGVRWLRDTLAPHRTPDGRLVGWEGVVTDITEQRLLADDLRRTTSMFHALIANLPMGVFFIQGPQGTPIFVNARARQLLGTREDNAAGLDHLSQIYRLYHSDGSVYPVEELPVYLALKQGRTTMRDDIVVHRPDGRRIPLVTWAAPVHLSRREAPDCAVWVLEDLTALHQAEAARKASEGRLRAILETMAEGLLVHDSKGMITSSNSAAGSIFQHDQQELSGRRIFDLGWQFLRDNGTVLPTNEHPTEIALRTGRPVRHVVLGIAPEKGDSQEAHRWLLVNAMPLGIGSAGGWMERGAEAMTETPQPFSRVNAPAGVITTFSDLTAYYHAREGIRQSEERYRGLVESLPLVLVQADRAMRLTYANPATKAVTGYELDEIADPHLWGQKIHPEDLPRVLAMSQAALEGEPDRCEMRYRTRTGEDRHCLAMSQPLIRDGGIIGTTTLLLDITRERQLERELDRARRLEIIGRLSSGVAHDFNNLLGVVLNLADLARGHLPADHPVHADLQRISEAGQQAAGLASQLLSFSKQRPMRARRLELDPIVRRTVDLLRSTLPRYILLETDLTLDHDQVVADETQIQQVLMNLCLNARDAMPEGGTLRVSTAVVDSPDSAHGVHATSMVCLRVEDTGHGIPEEMRGRIFEPFFTTKEGGTGLGLAVVQQIVESYGGSIQVSSRAGHGSRFEVYWPRV